MGTGHSLGGGLATALGAIFNISAITFSAPGLEATSVFLRPKVDGTALIRNSVNVVPSHDLVPDVDSQAGTVLRIRCPSKVPWTCHRLAGSMCEILASCGDGGGRPVPRGYNRTCHGCSRFKNAPKQFCSSKVTPDPDDADERAFDADEDDDALS